MRVKFESTNRRVATVGSSKGSLSFQRTRRSHDCKFMPLSASVNPHKHFFFPRIIPVWNGLPFSEVHASSVNLFKASIVLNLCYFISLLFLSAACAICYFEAPLGGSEYPVSH